MGGKNLFFVKSVLFTSLISFLLAELFFASFYYVFINIVQFIQIILSHFTNTVVEANSEIFGPVNVIIFLIGLVGVSFISFLEVSTIIGITIYDWYRNDHIPLKSIVSFVFKQLKKLFSLKTLPIFVLIMLLGKEHVGAGGLYSLEIPPFILDGIFANSLYTGIFFIVGVILLFIIYKSIFFVHVLLLEKDMDFFQSLKKSFEISKEIKFIGMVRIIIFTIFLSVLMIVPIVFILFLFRDFFQYFILNFGNVSIFSITLINWIENFMFLTMPGVLFFAVLTATYIKTGNFSEDKFLNTFDFVKSNPQEIKRFKNFRFLVNKLGKKGFSILLVLIFSIFVIFSLFFVHIMPGKIKQVSFIAHRGYLYQDGENKYIENTIGAIENAYNNGANFVEIDFYENKDGNLYLSHDSSLKRVAKISRKISDMTDEEIKKITLSNGSYIPSLEEVFKIAKQKNIKLLIEPKLHGKEKDLYNTLIKLIDKYDMYNLIKIHSLSLQTLLRIKELEPRIQVGYIVFGGIGNLSVLPVDFFSIQETIMSTYLVSSIHEAGKEVYIWTVNDLEYFEKYLFMGVDGFITDELGKLEKGYSVIKERAEYKPRYYLQFFGYKVLIPGS